MCIKIQKCYRGHYSRAHFADFYRRRLYLQHVTAQGEDLAQAVSLSSSLMQQLSTAARDEAHRQSVQDVLSHTHHLLSTASIPGVFASKWGAAYESTVDGVRVESIIQRLWQERQVELRSLREEVRREARRRQLHARRDVTEMRITRDGDSFDGVPAAAVRREEEAKVQLLEVEHTEEEEDEVEGMEFESKDDDGAEGERQPQQQQEERGEGYVRFPPIHSRPASGEKDGEMGLLKDREREVAAFNRSIILSRAGRPVTVERPRHTSR